MINLLADVIVEDPIYNPNNTLNSPEHDVIAIIAAVAIIVIVAAVTLTVLAKDKKDNSKK